MSKRYRYRPSRPPAERFWEEVNKNGPVPAHRPELGPCWLWLAYCRDGRYPWMYYEGHPLAAYRVAYILLVGPIPEGLQLDHLCRVTSCVNPAHLEPVTQQENIRRQMEAITHCPQGHKYTPENTGYSRGAGRNYKYCRICSRVNAARTRRSISERLCEHCGQPYKPGDYRQRFCGRICSRQAQLLRQTLRS
jgi:HNH endonuclease